MEAGGLPWREAGGRQPSTSAPTHPWGTGSPPNSAGRLFIYSPRAPMPPHGQTHSLEEEPGRQDLKEQPSANPPDAGASQRPAVSYVCSTHEPVQF